MDRYSRDRLAGFREAMGSDFDDTLVARQRFYTYAAGVAGMAELLAYLWLNTTPPALIWAEMKKAHAHGADRVWIVNVGDLLAQWTNDRWVSTKHRVVNPPREQWGNSRYSIPFFLHPRSSMPLDCLPGCVTAENPLHYEPITAGAYLDERLREIGLKK